MCYFVIRNPNSNPNSNPKSADQLTPLLTHIYFHAFAIKTFMLHGTDVYLSLDREIFVQDVKADVC